MKKTIQFALLAGAVAGVLALSGKLAMAEDGAPSCGMSCCGGGSTTAADISTNATPDLLTTCPVSGEKLGEMGQPYEFTYSNQVVKLCCPGCKKTFAKNPEKYIGEIRAADKKS